MTEEETIETATIVYRYGLAAPHEGAEVVRDQMQRARAYRRDLVSIERERRVAARQAMVDFAPEVDLAEAAVVGADAACQWLAAEIRVARKVARKRTETAAMRAGLARARAVCRAQREQLFALRNRYAAQCADCRKIKSELVPCPHASAEARRLRARLDAIDACAAALQRGARALSGLYWGCVDPETEILTEYGWRSCHEFRGVERVATYNTATRRLEWQQAVGKTVSPYIGKMARVSNARLDMLITPNHRVVYMRGHDIEIRHAEEMPRISGEIRVLQAADGLEPESPAAISPALASVLGWIVAEGYFDKNSAGILIHQSDRTNPTFVLEIRESLKVAGLTFTEYQQADDMRAFRIAASDGAWIRKLIPEKLLTPQLALHLSRESAQALFDALLHGDGSLGETSTGKPRWRWIQKNIVNVNMFQALSQRLGLATQISRRNDIHVVSVRLQPYSTWQGGEDRLPITWVDYDGIVWCPTTPNGTWVARRNGRVFITGNSYLLVERAMQASRAAPIYEKDGVTPHDPRLPYALSESVAVQIQSTRPLTVQGALAGTDSRLRLRPPPWPEAWLAAAALDATAPSSPSRRRPGQRQADGSPVPATRADGTPARWVRDRACREGELRMRVGPAGEWAAWRMDQHRPLPPASAITWATVVRRQRGPHAEWSLCLTVETPQAAPPPPTGRTVAVDVGWRVIGDTLRVAAWYDSDGRSGELRLSAKDLHALGSASQVRSVRDQQLDALKLRLGLWLDVAAPKDCPSWLRAETASLRLWRNPAKFVRLLNRWQAEGGPKTPVSRVAYDDLHAWATDDRHRWAEEEHRRAWSLRRRRERYRVFAAELASSYDTVVLERFDLRRVAERRPVGQDGPENEVARANRQLAAVSELRGAIQNACRARGRSVGAVDAVDSTRTCPSCGLVADRNQDARIVLRCECGHQWDQDREGAAPILLGRYRERPGDAKILVAARTTDNLTKTPKKKGSKWARAKRMSAQKKARGEAARASG